MKKRFLSRMVISAIVAVGLTWNCTPEEIGVLTTPPVANEDTNKQEEDDSNIQTDRAPELITGDYFVAPDGDDSNPGTLEEPWQTWSKAFKNAAAGDTVYFREGVYYSTSNNAGEGDFNSGTENAPICFFNYPGETPILDCTNRNVSGSAPTYNIGVHVRGVSNIHFKGLHIRNVNQQYDGNATGIYVIQCGNIVMENMVVHDIQGTAFTVGSCTGTVTHLNCDAYTLCNSEMSGIYAGGDGVGFYFNNALNTDASRASKVYYIGCRAWEFSDNGFDGNSNGYVEWDSCWAFDGGQIHGLGCGWKYCSSFGGISDNTLPVARTIKNCIGAKNAAYGFSPNNASKANMVVHCYNNLAYGNGHKDYIGIQESGEALGYGFRVMGTTNHNPPNGELYANNLSYGNEVADFIAHSGQLINASHNSWNFSLTVTNDDFISLDWTELKRPREEDGSLPDINFMKPKDKSQLIDKGLDVSLNYLGEAPDLGAFEIK